MSVFLDETVKNNRVGFIHIPKTGGTSVQNWLNHVYGRDNCKHFPHHRLSEISKEFLKDTIFTVVRNPYDRALSIYFYSYDMLKYKNIYAETITSKAQYSENDLNKGFEYYCENLLDFDLHYFGTNLNAADTMASYIRHSKKNIDHILKLENIKRDFSIIQDITKNYTPLPHLNVGTNSKSNHRHLYTAKAKKIVERYYEEDLDLFRYTF